MARETCSGCGAAAPEVKTAGTLAVLGWRMVIKPPTADQPARVDWSCPDCSARRAGSAPLSGNRPKG